ncbi:SpoIID/LytB domain-containing protein, partial [Candidatus Cyanaurora vandensis]
ATANCQVYKGLSGVTALTDKAVASTQGQVLTYQGELVDALYTSANGGTSARYSDLWLGRERPYLQAKPESLRPPNLGRLDQEANLKRLLGYRQDFNESGSPAFRWVRTYSSAKLVASLQENLPTLGLALPDLTTVTGLKVAERSTSGRVLRLAVQTNRGELTLSKDMILSAINQLPSTLFYVESAGDKGFRLVGGGWGHGLGLSQYGSYGLAKRGWDYQRILGFYFPQTNLSRWAS